MKKTLAQYVLPAFMLFAATGCLKDTGYDEQKYGIQIKEVKGVAFPEAASGEVATGITSSTTPVTINGPLITLEQDGYPTSTVNVGIQTNNNLVTAAGYTVLPTNSYTLNFTTVPILAGKKVTDTLKITFPNTSTLDPTKSYAIGFTIVSVDQGYKIATNQKEVLFTFTLKNKYDGVYSIKGYHVRGGDAALTGPTGTFERGLSTAGVSAVQWLGTVPWGFMASELPSGYQPLLTVNESTNKVTIASPNGLVSKDATYDSRYVPASRTFFIKWVYTGASERSFTDTLTWLRPR